MKLTTEHPSSSCNIPVFIDGENNPMNYADGLRQLRHEKGWSTADLGNELGVSRRTVEGWEQGRMPSVTALRLLQRIIAAP